MKLLLSLILILNLILNCKSASISFSDKIDCTTTPCQWTKATNWIGNVVPTVNDDVIISIGASAKIQGFKENILFRSLFLDSILSIEFDSGVTAVNQAVVLSQMTINGKLIINDPSVTVLSSSGSGTITIDPATDTTTQTTIQSSNLALLEVAGAAKAIVYGSTINGINQVTPVVSTLVNVLPLVAFTYSSNIGGIDIDSVPTFSPQSVFTLTNALPTTIDNIIGSNADQFMFLEYTSTITGSTVDNIAKLVLSGNSNCKIKDSTISGEFESQASSTVQFIGTNTINANVTLSGTVNIGSDSLQTNIEGNLIFSPTSKLTFNTLGNGAPLITIGDDLVLDGSIVIVVAEQPNTDASFKLLKSVGVVSGNFTSFSFKVGDEEIDSSTYRIMTTNGVFGIDFGDVVSSSDKIQISFISLILLLIISLLF